LEKLVRMGSSRNYDDEEEDEYEDEYSDNDLELGEEEYKK
jgi:hypothetical protein